MKEINIDELIQKISLLDYEGEVVNSIPMKKLTTFKIGGPADIVYNASSPDKASHVIKYLNDNNIPHMYLGCGSNLLVKDGGYRGVMIRARGINSDIIVKDNIITAEAGVRLSALASAAAQRSLSGLEFASGIPGSVGGGIFMNAGAYDMEIKDTLISVTAIMPDGSIKVFNKDELDLAYRHSVFMENHGMIVDASFQLTYGNKDDILGKIKDLNKRRREKQPLEYPSAGSTFKRPKGDFAARLIDATGCKNLSFGGAKVSSKHAGFIINKGDAKASDVLTLMELVKISVKEYSGIELESEIQIVGE